MFHLRFGLSDHLKTLLDFVFGSRRRVKKVRIFRAWFSQFAEHIEGLHMPPCVNEKIGRLVGYMELKKNRSKGTSLDIASENRHEALKQKRMLIGCEEEFQQECSQSYSPVSQWIIEVALTLTDESQQFGNIEETSVIARTSRTCLNVWARDHRQTPGGLKNTVECRLFRQSSSKGTCAKMWNSVHPAS